MTEPLVDADGFPRNDIDVYQVRHARHEIYCSQNDLKDLMQAIAVGLEDYHAEGISFQSPKNPPGIASNAPETSTSVVRDRNPFVIINLVSPNSPAEEAVSSCLIKRPTIKM